MSADKKPSNFSRFAKLTARSAGHPVTFGAAVGIILVWAVTGPLFGFSDTWQLVINTGTTIITFLMVFLIQNTQNRDAEASQLKLDELIRALKGAKNSLLDLEELEEEQLDEVHTKFERMARKARGEPEKQVEGNKAGKQEKPVEGSRSGKQEKQERPKKKAS